MNGDGFVASLLLSRASVQFDDDKPVQPNFDKHAVWQGHYKKLRRKAYFCRSPKRTKALLNRDDIVY